MRKFTAEEALELMEEEFYSFDGDTAEVTVTFDIDYGCAWACFDSEYWERPITVCYDPDNDSWTVSYWNNVVIAAERKIDLVRKVESLIDDAEERGREIYEERMTPDISDWNREYGSMAVAY